MITFQAQKKKITKGQKPVSYSIVCFKDMKSFKPHFQYFLLMWKWKAMGNFVCVAGTLPLNWM